MRRAVNFATAAFLACGVSAGAVAGARLTNEQMAAIDHSVAAFLISLECGSVRKDNDVGDALLGAVGVNEQNANEGPVADYYAMRFEIETSALRRLGKGEYCAAGWWRYGDNGTVIAGLITRPPPISSQPELTPAQEQILTEYATAVAVDVVCPGLESRLEPMLDHLDQARLPHGSLKGTRAGEFVGQRQADALRQRDEVGLDRFCADGWSRFGSGGSVVPGLLLRSE